MHKKASSMTSNLFSLRGRIRDDIEKEDAFCGLCAMVISSSDIAYSIQITKNWTLPNYYKFPIIESFKLLSFCPPTGPLMDDDILEAKLT